MFGLSDRDAERLGETVEKLRNGIEKLETVKADQLGIHEPYTEQSWARRHLHKPSKADVAEGVSASAAYLSIDPLTDINLLLGLAPLAFHLLASGTLIDNMLKKRPMQQAYLEIAAEQLGAYMDEKHGRPVSEDVEISAKLIKRDRGQHHVSSISIVNDTTGLLKPGEDASFEEKLAFRDVLDLEIPALYRLLMSGMMDKQIVEITVSPKPSEEA